MRKFGVKQVAKQLIKDLPKLRLSQPLPHVRGRYRGQARLWREAVRWFRIMAAKQGLYEAKECPLRAEVKHIRQQAAPPAPSFKAHNDKTLSKQRQFEWW